MPLQSDQKALVFLGAIAVLGAGVRMARAARPAPATQPALAHQAHAADSARRAAGRNKVKNPSAPKPRAAVPSTAGPRGRLDLDIATATQIDSLPGMSPTLSKRIVVDRGAHGPFTSIEKLRRVKGVSAALVQRIDSLVTFSGTIRPFEPTDTVIAKSKKKRGPPAP
jgi:competence protein ComEA